MVADEPITPLDLGSSTTDDEGSPVEVGGEEAVSGRAPLLQFSLIYVSPTPGGSGVAEFATLGFMAGLVPLGAMAAFTILWRAATGYLPIAAGGLGIGVDLAIRTWKGGGGEAR